MPPSLVLAEGGLPDKPYIYVEGTAEIQKPADIVTLRFEIVCRAPNQPKANDQTCSLEERRFLVSLLRIRSRSNGRDRRNDRTGPEFEQISGSYTYSGSRGKLIGYIASRTFEVIVRDVPAFPKLVEKLLAIDGVEFSAIQGSGSKQKEVAGSTLGQGSVDARATS